MASGRAADRDDPKKSKRRAARSLERDPISELHQGQRSNAPHQRAGHMTAPDHFAEAELNILRKRGPSTYDFWLSSPIDRKDPRPLDPCLRPWSAMADRDRCMFDRLHLMILAPPHR